MNKVRLLQPMFVVIAALTGYSYWSTALVERERSQFVEPNPQVITCENLISDQPLTNRHVTLIDCWFGEYYACQTKRDSPDFDFVYVPVYSNEIGEEAAGDHIHLLAHVTNIRNQDQLLELLGAEGLTGCVWDDHTVGEEMAGLLHQHYPKLDISRCRILEIGEPIPTIVASDRYFLKSYLSFALAIAVAVWLIVQNFQLFLGLSEDPAKANPYAEPEGHHDSHTTTPQNTLLQSLGGNLSGNLIGLCILGGLVWIGLKKTGVVSYDVGNLGMSVAVIAIVFACWLPFARARRFLEHQHLAVRVDELPLATRQYFECHTPAFLNLGFRLLGDEKESHSAPLIIRYFLSSDGALMGILAMGTGVDAYSFSSITSEGVSHETTTIDTSELHVPKLPRRLQTVSGSIDAVHNAHRLWMRQHSERTGEQILSLQPDDVPCVLDYDHKLSYWALYMKGVVSCRPPRLPRVESIADLQAARNARILAEQEASLENRRRGQ